MGYNLPMATISPDFGKLIPEPLSEIEETVLDQHPLIASAFLHPDDPRHLEFSDVQAAVFDAEGLAAVAGLPLLPIPLTEFPITTTR